MMNMKYEKHVTFHSTNKLVPPAALANDSSAVFWITLNLDILRWDWTNSLNYVDSTINAHDEWWWHWRPDKTSIDVMDSFK